MATPKQAPRKVRGAPEKRVAGPSGTAAAPRPFAALAPRPTAKSVAATLGAAARWYDELVSRAAGFEQQWSHSKASGWMLKVHDGKKALFYLVPLGGSYQLSLTVRPDERDALVDDARVAVHHESLRSAKKYSEGYALRMLVADAPTARAASTLVERIIELRA